MLNRPSRPRVTALIACILLGSFWLGLTFSNKAPVKGGETGRVVAFEPNPGTLTLLRENVAVNRARNVIVEPIACADRDQMLTLYAAPAPNTGASSLSRENATVSPDQQPK